MSNNLTVHQLFAGEGDIRARLRQFDWSGSPLGHPDAWPRNLATVVRLMLNSKFPMFVAWGPELVFLYNDEYAPILGNKHPRALGEPFADVWSEIWPDVGPIARDALEGRSSYFENRPLEMRRTGRTETAWFTFSYSPVEGDSGTVEGMYCTCIETTGQVLAQRRQSFQLRLADAVRALQDPDQIVATANRILGEHLNVSRVGFCEIEPDDQTFFIRSDWNLSGLPSIAGTMRVLDDFGPVMIDALRANQPVLIGDVAADARTAQHAQSYTRLGIRSVLALPLVKSGRLTAVLILHNIEPREWSEEDVFTTREMAERTWAAVERARAQAELRAERDRSKYITDSMDEGFAQIAADWTVTNINTEGARLMTRPAEAIVGHELWSLFPGSVRSPRGDMYRRVRDQRMAESMETPFRFDDGRNGWMDIRAYPSLDGGITLFFRDITDRKRTESELTEANRRKDEFLAMLAHELRNPLAPISAAAELMQLSNMNESRLRQTSQVISRQVRHMTGLVDDLLDVSRVTRGLVTISRTPQDIKRIVSSAVEQARPLMESRRHHLVLDLSAEPAHVMGDENRLVQILANLLNNAAKYTPEGGEVQLRTEVREHEVVLCVCDNGIGIAPAIQERIFDLFAQAERSPDRSQGGLGLGLALVRSLVELHGGRVYCQSDGEGRGSSFMVHLPRMDAAQEASAGWDVPARAKRAQHRLKLLVVDDNKDAAEMLAMLLDASGHQVIVETSSPRALARAGADRPDVCLLDIGLPEMDGYELARRIRATDGLAGTVLIAVTGYGQESDREKAAAAGFDHHFVKPIDTHGLIRLLANL